MQFSILVLTSGIAVVTSVVLIILLRRLSIPLGLIDHPNERKHHMGHVPLVGGLAIFPGVLIGAFLSGQLHRFGDALLIASVLIVIMGALDDRRGLSVGVRLLMQCAAILAVTASTGVYVNTLGHLFGHDMRLGPWLGIPITVIAVIGLMNAFNMLDGIDGLTGSMALICIATISLFVGPLPVNGSLTLMAMLTAAVLPYLAANLGFMGPKIFLGDAGSMLIGFLLSWILIRFSQQPHTPLSPVNVLWCVALPVLDTLAVMYRRMRQGKSPFKPDCGHIHHLLLRAGLGPRAVLGVLIALAAAMGFAGTVAKTLHSGAGSNLMAFCVLLVCYTLTVTWVWKRQEARLNPTLVTPVPPVAHVVDIQSASNRHHALPATLHRQVAQVERLDAGGSED